MDPLLTFLLGLALGVVTTVLIALEVTLSAVTTALKQQQKAHLRERMYLVRQFSGKLDAIHEDVMETTNAVEELRQEMEMVEEEDEEEDEADWWKTGGSKP